MLLDSAFVKAMINIFANSNVRLDSTHADGGVRECASQNIVCTVEINGHVLKLPEFY
jgi:hypothetical protein